MGLRTCLISIDGMVYDFAIRCFDDTHKCIRSLSTKKHNLRSHLALALERYDKPMPAGRATGLRHGGRKAGCFESGKPNVGPFRLIWGGFQECRIQVTSFHKLAHR